MRNDRHPLFKSTGCRHLFRKAQKSLLDLQPYKKFIRFQVKWLWKMLEGKKNPCYYEVHFLLASIIITATANKPWNTYLWLTEFEGHTVNYGLRFSPLIYGPSAKRTGHKSKGKNKGPLNWPIAARALSKRYNKETKWIEIYQLQLTSLTFCPGLSELLFPKRSV